MHAAVVTAFDTPPTYEHFPTPTPQTADEVLVSVIAAGLHPRVRSQANGSHYTSSDELPLVPGIDGVEPHARRNSALLHPSRHDHGHDGRTDRRRPPS